MVLVVWLNLVWLGVGFSEFRRAWWFDFVFAWSRLKFEAFWCF